MGKARAKPKRLRKKRKVRQQNTADRSDAPVAAEARIAARLAALERQKKRLSRMAVSASLRKQQKGKTLTASESRRLARWNAIHAEQDFWVFCRRCPQIVLRVLSGRQTKQINEQAARYGFAWGGAAFDWAVVVPQWFEFLAKNADALAVNADGMADARRRRASALADLEEIKRDRELGLLVNRTEADRELQAVSRWVVAIFERAGAELGAKIAGKNLVQVRRISKAYFDAFRNQAVNGRQS